MDVAAIWRQFFATWPEGIPQKGVVVTSYDEQVNFMHFLLSEHVLMLERLAPDSVGGRRVIIPYANIQAVKMTEPIKNDVFHKAGYLPGGRPTKPAVQDR